MTSNFRSTAMNSKITNDLMFTAQKRYEVVYFAVLACQQQEAIVLQCSLLLTWRGRKQKYVMLLKLTLMLILINILNQEDNSFLVLKSVLNINHAFFFLTIN